MLYCSPDSLVRFCGSTTHPAIEHYQTLELSVNQARREALEKKVKTLADEGSTLRGQLDAITQQLQRDEREVQTLSQEEQALTKEWQTLTTSLNITLQPQDDIAPWLAAQEEHEQQLHQLSLRHALQAQITAHSEQITQLQLHIEQRQTTLLAELARYGLSLPADDDITAWLNARVGEAQMWQRRQNELTELQAKMAQLAPLLETLPETGAKEETTESLALENWRQVHDDCLSLQGQWQSLQQQEAQEAQRAAEIQAQFDSALQASVFDDRDTFLAALLDEEAFNHLEHLSNRWKASDSRRKRCLTRLSRRWQRISSNRLPARISHSPWTIFAMHWRSSRNNCGITPRARAKFASSSGRMPKTASSSRP